MVITTAWPLSLYSNGMDAETLGTMERPDGYAFDLIPVVDELKDDAMTNFEKAATMGSTITALSLPDLARIEKAHSCT